MGLDNTLKPSDVKTFNVDVQEDTRYTPPLPMLL